MRTLNKQVLVSVLFLALTAAPAAWADNSSPAANGSNTSGYSINPHLDIRPGKVETRRIELGAKGGSASSSVAGQGATFQGNVRVPVHMWGKQGQEEDHTHVSGVLLDLGASVRVDTAKGNVNRLMLDGPGVAAYRWQGASLHSTSNDLNEQTFLQAREKANFEKQNAQYEAELNATAKPLAEALADFNANLAKDPTGEAYKKRLVEIIKASPLMAYSGGMGISYDAVTRALNRGRTPRQALEEVFFRNLPVERKIEPNKSEAHATGEVVLGRAGYRYHDVKDSGARQNGAVLTPFSMSGAAAARINGVLNVGICGALKPGEFLAGQSRGAGFFSMGAEGCLDVTPGEFPTIRDKAGVNYAFDISDASKGEANNRRFVFSNELSVSKKLGPITPELAWTHEKDCVGTKDCVNRNMFTAGAAF